MVPKNLSSVQRIISIPITRPRNPAGKLLTYYQFQVHFPPPETKVEQPTQSKWRPQGGYMNWAREKAASTWSSFGKAPEGNWKLKVFQTGERFVDRIDFEEHALKAVDPSSSPISVNTNGQEAQETHEKQKVMIPLLYAPSVQSAEVCLAQLQELVRVREPKHKKGFWMWMLLIPFTAPFKLIPIIPNLPFFFCAYRSWSHYRAYRASQYLAVLLKHGLVVCAPSPELDAIYKQFGTKLVTSSRSETELLPRKTLSEDSKVDNSSVTADSVEMLLTREAVPAIVSTFSLEETASADMYRAFEQARVRTKSST